MADAFATATDLGVFTQRTIVAAQADMMLAQASAIIRSHCGWHIAPQRTDTLTLDGTGSRDILLPSMNVVEVASVSEDDVDLEEGTDYRWSADGYLHRLACHWTANERGVVVELTHGYGDDEVPQDLASVCLSMAARMVANPLGAKSESSAGVSITYGLPGGLNDYELAVLRAYKVAGRA